MNDRGSTPVFARLPVVIQYGRLCPTLPDLALFALKPHCAATPPDSMHLDGSVQKVPGFCGCRPEARGQYQVSHHVPVLPEALMIRKPAA